MPPEQLGLLVLGLGTLVGLFFMIYTPIMNNKNKCHEKELTEKLAQANKDHAQDIERLTNMKSVEASALKTTSENTAALGLLTAELKHQSELWADAIRKNSETHGIFRRKFEEVDEHLHLHDTQIALHDKEITRLQQYHPPGAAGRRKEDV